MTATSAPRPAARRAGTPVRRRKRLPSPTSSGPAATILAWLYALVLAIPLYYLLVSSLKDNIGIFTNPFGLPTEPIWENFAQAWNRAQLGTALLNSVLISVVAVALTLVLAIPAAYALARSESRFARAITGVYSASFLIPPFAALIPTVILAIQLDLFYTREFQMLFLPASALPLSILLLTQFMKTVPPELVEAASIDGAGQWSILRRIFIPLSMPGIVSVTILQVLTFWNEYLFSLTITGTSPEIRTVQVALPSLISDSTRFGVLAAGTVITLVPVYLAYAILQKRMQEALTAGALKG
ncbi:carbohydrate ABC transporter permease [Compostimonas suwonensis]|uniref:ABC-type glycerol-3-phosphate transport system permease component n=1 Tax=Compostimonas suwonensis TaxID=1048394 RepID=A0A2M9BC75_9MICO|nr:carbohydrate ABC transporter permease [Compostimonas suwonensis]PJJ55536.1 ABC-type glycerol-3-phosphate transport system permease component [Compostimonas suwonensis]